MLDSRSLVDRQTQPQRNSPSEAPGVPTTQPLRRRSHQTGQDWQSLSNFTLVVIIPAR